jgi:hypothetical protein
MDVFLSKCQPFKEFKKISNNLLGWFVSKKPY